MAIKNRKGYVHTLEGVLAFFMIFSYILFVLPAIKSSEPQPDAGMVRMSDTLDAMLESSSLDFEMTNRNVSGIRYILHNAFPEFDIGVKAEYTNTQVYSLNSSGELNLSFYYDGSANYEIDFITRDVISINLSINDATLSYVNVSSYLNIPITPYLVVGINNISIESSTSSFVLLKRIQDIAENNLQTPKLVTKLYRLNENETVVLYVFVE